MKVLDTISQVLKDKNGLILTIDPDTSVFDALSAMAEEEVGALLVMEAGRLVGVISERDYARKVILVGRSSRQTKVSEIMTAPAVVVDPNATVDDAMHLMTERRIRHLPVVNREGAVLGVVSIGDLIKWIMNAHEHTIEQLKSYITAG